MKTTMTYQNAVEMLNSEFKGLGSLQGSIADWFSKYAGSEDFAKMDTDTRQDETYRFYRLNVFFQNLERAINNNRE
jgi:hypothetical protein